MVRSRLFVGFFVFAGSALASAVTFAADGDVVEGEKIYKRCSACHMIGDDAKNRVGPVLTGVVGRQAGTYEDYKYGKSIVEAGEAGLVWNQEELSEYLLDPKKYLRAKLDNKRAKSKMAFRLKDEEDRNNVIAYLKTFSPELEEEAEADQSASEEAASTTSSD